VFGARVGRVAPLALVLATALTLSACGSDSSGSDSGSGSGSGSGDVAKEITIWSNSNVFWDWQKANLAPFTQATGIKVNYTQIPDANIIDKTSLAQRSKSDEFAMYEGPTSLIAQDVQLTGGGTDLKPYVDNKDLTGSDFNFSDFAEGGIKDCTFKGTLYCLPVFVDGGGLAVNKKLLAQAGVTSSPKTWDEVVKAADAVTQKTGTPGWCTRGSQAGAAIATANQMLSYYIPFDASNQGFFVDKDWKSLLDSPGALEWANTYQHLMTKDAPRGIGTYTLTNCQNDFDQGKVAMMWDGIVVFNKNELDPKPGSPLAGNVDFVEPSCPSSDPCVATGPWGMFLNPRASKPQQAAAWKLMQYLSSPKVLTDEITATGVPALAVRNSTTQEKFPGIPASVLEALRWVGANSEPNPFPPSTVFNESQNAYQTSISDIVAGKDVAKAMKSAADGQNQVFQQAGLQN
jgi:ABC-type glycerol-3-phosphate transport system substrate-binding protein